MYMFSDDYKLSNLDISESGFLEKIQDRMILYKSSDKIRACLNDPNKETQLNLENNGQIIEIIKVEFIK